jgi:hypothetical protein
MNPLLRSTLCAAAAAAVLATSAVADTGSRSSDGSAIPAAMRASFDEKMRLIEAIVAAIENGPDGSRVTVANVVWLREALYRLPLDKLQELGTPSTMAQAAQAIALYDGTPAKLGSTSNELVYYPITPCRYIDTRVVGGPLVNSRTYDLSLTGGAYGGSVGCDPKQAVGGNKDQIGALAMNVTIISPTSPIGFIGVRPAGDTAVTSFVNWYEQGSGVQMANAGLVPINQQPTPSADIEFFGSPTQFIVDIFGVFAAPSATTLDCALGGLVSATVNPSTPNYQLFAPGCAAGYTTISINCNVSGGDYVGGHLTRSKGGVNAPGPTATCVGHYNGATSATVTAQRLCCRVPGR